MYLSRVSTQEDYFIYKRYCFTYKRLDFIPKLSCAVVVKYNFVDPFECPPSFNVVVPVLNFHPFSNFVSKFVVFKQKDSIFTII